MRATLKGSNLALADGGPLVIPPEAARTLSDALMRTARQSPARGIVFVSNDGVERFQSYAELLEEAQMILAGLHEIGLRPRDHVILQLQNLQEHFAAFWACVLGGIAPATVAIASSYAEPNATVNKLINVWKLLGSPIILASEHLVDSISGLREKLGLAALEVRAIGSLRKPQSPAPLAANQPNDVVFFQLTSGSTGIPKCIQETHRGIISHIHGSAQFNGYTPDDVSLNWLPLDHVVPILTFHLKDVYLGCQQIHVQTAAVLANPLLWLDLIQKYRVTHTWAPNFGFKLVSDRLAHNANGKWDLASMRFFMNAGEQVTVPVIKEFLEKVAPFGITPAAMQPAFGMAEACTCMTYQNDFDFETGVHTFSKSSLPGLLKRADSHDAASISFVDLGPPVPGVQIRITDRKNEVLPEGVIGRFQIKGDVITPGYFNNESANRDAFVGDGWFNSGDLGFILDGRLTLTGREKEMIIIRGANFYCYEIEDTVNQIEGVEPTFVAACAVDDASSGTEGLAIFFVPDSKRPIDRLKLIRAIKTQISAGFGIKPSFVVPLERASFPKTTSGKIQRMQLKRALEAGEFTEIVRATETSPAAPATTPKTETERRIAAIWSEVLGLSEFGTDVPFFEVGDSLRAAQVTARLRDAFAVEFTLRTLFEEASTIAAMARYIETPQKSNASRAVPPIRPVDRSSPLRVSHGQRRAWFLDQMAFGTALYNVPVGLWLRGPLDTRALEESLNEIVRRHEILRTVYALEQDDLVQRIEPPFAFSLTPVNLENIPVEERRDRAWQMATDEAQRPFDLALGPVIRAQLFRLGPEEHWLAVTVHQIAIDGWSLTLLIQELAEGYESRVSRRIPSRSALPIQYADFAHWQRENFKGTALAPQFEYWKSKLSGMLPVLRFPANTIHDGATDHAGATESRFLPADVVSAVKTLARQQGATLFMTLLAAFKVLLRWYCQQEEIVVASAAGGRHRLELERLIGFFVNTVVLRTTLPGKLSFLEHLRNVRQNVLAAHANQDLPFDELAGHLKSEAGRGRPLFQVWFALNDRLPSVHAGPLKISSDKILLPLAQFDLTLFTQETDKGGLRADLEYSTAVFDQATAAWLLTRFEALLRTVAQKPETTLTELTAVLGERTPGKSISADLREKSRTPMTFSLSPPRGEGEGEG